MADVAFEEVDKIYDNGVQAVFELTLDAHDGEFLVLVGPSGCGKTTALRMLAGLEEQTSGDIFTLGERVVNDVAPKDRDIAMVFQNYALYPHMSVYDNIAFGLSFRGMPEAGDRNGASPRSATMLAIGQLPLKRKPKGFSGGQRQRVALGRASSAPRTCCCSTSRSRTSTLSCEGRGSRRDPRSCRGELGLTTVMGVTHDQEEALTMADRLVVMNGRCGCGRSMPRSGCTTGPRTSSSPGSSARRR